MTENRFQTRENHFRSDRKSFSDPGKPFPKRSEAIFRPGKTISEAIGSHFQTRENHFRSDRKPFSDPGKPFPKRSEAIFRPGKTISDEIQSAS